MPSLTVHSHLDANLASLGIRNPDLARRISAISPPSTIVFDQTADGVPCATLDGRQLCSRHHPLQEADRLADGIDLVEHAAIVVLGFGLGHHVERLAELSDKAALIIVFEPDVALLRAAFEQIDHSHWLREAIVVFVTNPTDRGTLASQLQGAESILAQGVEFIHHPPSRARLSALSAQFVQTFSDHITTVKTTLTTTLMRSVDTVRNLMLNLDHYAAGPGITDLQNIACGFPAVIVSAGPSLQRNIDRLTMTGVRDRCIIIAVQTALKPLLDAGVKPHFVTALDYHEISQRFYEGLSADDVRGVTLVAEPKANPAILDIFPGPIRCCANGFLDQLLGSLKRNMGTLPAGATVAHLAVYLARYMGCNPIALIGQDLAFTNGLYYAPGTAIHDVWAPELNPFNTIEMMEWQRIARHRQHLRKAVDVHGKSIYTDAQMQTYLHQFERDFAQYKAEGLTIVDATEGGLPKQHTIAMTLQDFLGRYTDRSLPTLPAAGLGLDAERLPCVRQRIAQIDRDIQSIREIAHKTISLIKTMLNEQHDQAKMAEHFEAIDRYRKQIEDRLEAFELLNHLNQVGVFKRMKTDRRLHLQRGNDPIENQRGQLERDLENVRWIAEAAAEMIEQIQLIARLLEGHQSEERHTQGRIAASKLSGTVAALIAIDPQCNGLGIPRTLSETFDGKPVLQATLERLGQSKSLHSIILIASKNAGIESLIDRSRVQLPVEIEWCDGSPFGPEHEAIAVARLWADSCWRGGIGGMSAYDEVLCPQIMHEVMQRRSLSAALIAGPDWPLIDVTSRTGCDALVSRHLERPQHNNLVFTQPPPGLCGCLISASLMKELSQRNRLSTAGGLLVYQPHAPQHDPIARDANMQIDHRVRQSLIRATFDTTRQRELMRRAFSSIPIRQRLNSRAIVAAIEDAACGLARPLPHHLTLELCTNRTSRGIFTQHHPHVTTNRHPITPQLAGHIFNELQRCDDSRGSILLTLGGAGDPLLHPQFHQIVAKAKSHGVRAVHVRTELLTDRASLDRLLDSGVDVVSIDLNADRAATYQNMMGVDRFKDVLLNIEYLLEHRRHLTPQTGTVGFGLPWIVPRIQRCAETYEDIDTFFDRWQHRLGTAVIDSAPPIKAKDNFLSAIIPPQVVERDLNRSMTIFCDGSVPIDESALSCLQSAGNIETSSLAEVWSTVLRERAGMHANRVRGRK